MSDDNRLKRFNRKIDEKFGEGFYQVIEYTYAKLPCKIKCLNCNEIKNFGRAENVFRANKICNCSSVDIQRFKYEQKIKNKYKEDIRFLKFTNVKEPCIFICCECHSIDYLESAQNIMLREHVCKHCFPGGVRGGVSNGELKIEKFLIENNIKYRKQYVFKEIGKKKFDFALLNNKNEVIGIIEFDGKQHFIESSFFGGKEKFEEIKKNDKLKNHFCKSNNIPLLRIKYNEYDKINELLTGFINKIDFTKTLNDYRNHVS